MKEFLREVAGTPVEIRVVEHEDDLEGFRDFIRRNLRGLGVDSETTGLDIYSDTFRLRLVQFGTDREAWVIPTELGPRFEDDARKALEALDKLVLHNASYDLQVFDRKLGVPMESLWPKVTDTRILAHLVDPRGQEEGGIGQGLEQLTKHYIDTEVAEKVKTLMKDLAKEYKTTKAKIWEKVELDHPDYLLYSGMDPILACRLEHALRPKVPAPSAHLIPYEHQIAEVCSIMERTGFLLDVEYSQELSDKLTEEQSKYEAVAEKHGCENVNSTEQVADVLESRGVKIKGRTPTGKRKVDKKLLTELVEQEDEFAEAVVEAKRARKWRTTWVDGFLKQRDSQDRCHAAINPLRARTARMSITGIPAQTLPSGDWMVRRCFLADEGHLMSSVDYQAQELRVLAALSGDKVMQKAFAENADLHQITADSAAVPRKVGKMANFLVVYGGGPGTLAESASVPFPVARRVLQSFDRTYPAVKQLSQYLQGLASRQGYIETPLGRRLPVDAARGYSALNYMIQSTSRDVTCRGLLQLHENGFTPYLRLPIHDEVLASIPTEHAEWGAQQIGKHMALDFKGVHIGTDPEVGGRSWGSLYGAEY